MHCSTDVFLYEELEIIVGIAEKHGYKRGIIYKMFNEILRWSEEINNSRRNHCVTDNRGALKKEKKEYEVVTEPLGNYKTVKNLLKKNRKNPAFKRGNTIWSRLRNVKDIYNKEEQTGVYEIPIMNNTKHQKEVYIGTTGRNLKQRLKEHIEDIRKGKLTTALARRRMNTISM